MLREFTGMIHSVGFYQKMAIDESILRFVIPTWILLNFYSTVSSLSTLGKLRYVHNFKSGNISGKIRHCVIIVLTLNTMN